MFFSLMEVIPMSRTAVVGGWITWLLVSHSLLAQGVPKTANEIQAGGKVVTITDSSLVVGSRSKATLSKGAELRVLTVKNGWVGVSYDQDGEEIRGWIPLKNVVAAPSAPLASQDVPAKRVEETVSGAEEPTESAGPDKQAEVTKTRIRVGREKAKTMERNPVFMAAGADGEPYIFESSVTLKNGSVVLTEKDMLINAGGRAFSLPHLGNLSLAPGEWAIQIDGRFEKQPGIIESHEHSHKPEAATPTRRPPENAIAAEKPAQVLVLEIPSADETFHGDANDVLFRRKQEGTSDDGSASLMTKWELGGALARCQGEERIAQMLYDFERQVKTADIDEWLKGGKYVSRALALNLVAAWSIKRKFTLKEPGLILDQRTKRISAILVFDQDHPFSVGKSEASEVFTASGEVPVSLAFHEKSALGVEVDVALVIGSRLDLTSRTGAKMSIQPGQSVVCNFRRNADSSPSFLVLTDEE